MLLRIAVRHESSRKHFYYRQSIRLLPVHYWRRSGTNTATLSTMTKSAKSDCNVPPATRTNDWARNDNTPAAAVELVGTRSSEFNMLRIHLMEATTTTLRPTAGHVAFATKSHAAVAANNDDDVVLQYERQRRKAQHSKRDGAPVGPLRILYRDHDLLVLHKPSGVLTVPGLQQKHSLLDSVYEHHLAAQEHAASANDTLLKKDHMIVHRLDMDTSGVVVFGRNLRATQSLQACFRERSCHKTYQALVMGHWPSFDDNDAVLIDLPVQRDHRHPPFWRVATPAAAQAAHAAVPHLQSAGYAKLVRQAPKPSQTVVRVLERGYGPMVRNADTSMHHAGGAGSAPKIQRDSDQNEQAVDYNLPYTRLALEPLTGRTHQLRIHCAALGFAIVGDPCYSLYGEAAPQGGLAQVPIALPALLAAARPSLSCQRAWLAAYPPNERPMCLHAWRLQIMHPRTGESVFETPPDF